MCAERKAKQELEELRGQMRRLQESERKERRKLAEDDALRKIKKYEDLIGELQRSLAAQKQVGRWGDGVTGWRGDGGVKYEDLIGELQGSLAAQKQVGRRGDGVMGGEVRGPDRGVAEESGRAETGRETGGGGWGGGGGGGTGWRGVKYEDLIGELQRSLAAQKQVGRWGDGVTGWRGDGGVKYEDLIGELQGSLAAQKQVGRRGDGVMGGEVRRPHRGAAGEPGHAETGRVTGWRGVGVWQRGNWMAPSWWCRPDWRLEMW